MHRKAEIILAGGLVVDEQQRLLVIHRVDPDQWELPGGFVEDGESPAEAVVRELDEELGIEVVTTNNLGETTFEENDKKYRYQWFGAALVKGRPWPQEKKFDACDFFGVRTLSRMENLSLNMKKLLKQIVDGEVRLS